MHPPTTVLRRARVHLLLAVGLALLTGCGRSGLESGAGAPGGGDPGANGPRGGRTLAGDIGPGTPDVPAPVPAGARYVSPDGDDAAAGTEGAPWRTLARAVSGLQAGDTLVMRGGAYRERAVPIALRGTATAPITIRGYPGEQPVVDGAFPQFQAAGNQDWEVVDAGRVVYRSTATFAGSGQVFGYLGPGDGGHRLVPYESLAALSADGEDYTESGEYYCGPGVFWNGGDQRIYVRLQRSRYQLQFGHGNVPADLDPRRTPMFLFPGREVLSIAANTQHVVFADIAFRHGERVCDVPGTAHHLTMRRCELRIGRYGVIVRDGARELIFDGLSVRGHFPPWVARSDIKADTNPAHSMQDAGFEISGDVQGVEIRDCVFDGLFDAIDTVGAPQRLAVHHCEFVTIRDDAFELATAGYDVEFHHNFVHRAAAAVSWNGSRAPRRGFGGRKYIHHNVIDTSVPQLYGRADPQGLSPPKWLGPAGDGMATGPAFGVHETGGLDGPDPWKVYHNTFVGGADVDAEGLGVCYVFPPSDANEPHEVLNNVFVQTGDQWILRRARLHDGSQRYDGNLYHRRFDRPTTALFQEFTDGSITRSYATLLAFKTSGLWPASQAHYPPGWEAEGVEADPHLDEGYRPAAGGAAASGVVDLAGRQWPGAGADGYRGAVPPGR